MTSGNLVLPPPVDVSDVLNLGRRASILLSASMPVERNPAEYEPAEQQLVDASNLHYALNARPERIRAAVVALTRVTLQRGARLVFGAHPTISPMVLQVAQDMDALPESILVFQSDAYGNRIPGSTLHFANWEKGQLILTRRAPEIPPSRLKRMSPFPNSLRLMREAMASVPGLLGAVFIGGMKGVEDEAELCIQRQLRCYAFPSTGSAASRLVQQQPGLFHGTLKNPNAFHTTLSYTVAASMVLDELLPPAAGHP